MRRANESTITMPISIQRIGTTRRWSDVVLHRGTAYFVEVPDDATTSLESQIEQVLRQVETRLQHIGSSHHQLLQVTIYLPNPADLPIFNALWDAWVPDGTAPSRACVHAPLVDPNYRVELVIVAAYPFEN